MTRHSKTILAATSAILLLAACNTGSTPSQSHLEVNPEMLAGALKAWQETPKVEPNAKPMADLIVIRESLLLLNPTTGAWPDVVSQSFQSVPETATWQEKKASGYCSATEGNFPFGTYQLLQFDVATLNIGDAPLHLGDITQLIGPGYDKNDPSTESKKLGGYFEWGTCHNHWHYRNYAKYEMIKKNADGSLGAPVRGRKQGYCMIDTYFALARSIDPNAQPTYNNNGQCTYQGLSPKWGDMYDRSLDGQFFLLNEPGKVLDPGNYILRVTVNPPFFPVAGEICPVRDLANMCRIFPERNYNNNVAEVEFALTAAQINGTGTSGQSSAIPQSLPPRWVEKGLNIIGRW